MTEATTAAVLREPSEVHALLQDAGRSGTVVLTRRECRWIDRGGNDLPGILLDVARHHDECAGEGSREILGQDRARELGHAPAWIDAGSTYEELLDLEERRGTPDFIFCLDPWAAQLLTRTNDRVAPEGRWILVADLEQRKSAEHGDYWKEMESWFLALPFSAIVPRALWEQALETSKGPEEDVTPAAETGAIYLEKPGAWRWRKITGGLRSTGVEDLEPLVFLIRSSGSVQHLKAHLETLVRQDVPKRSLRPFILSQGWGKEQENLLKWFRLAHPELTVRYADVSAATGNRWTFELNRALEETPGSTAVMVDDHALLPGNFVGVLRTALAPIGVVPLFGIPLDLDASSHIVTGNLDPLAQYQELMKAFGEKAPAPLGECARIVSTKSWNNGSGEPFERLLRVAQDRPSPGKLDLSASRNVALLLLADLP